MFDDDIDNTPDDAVTFGTRFTARQSLAYQINGERHYHTRTLLQEVTGLTETGFDYRTVEVLAEDNRPDFAATPTGGQMAWFGWRAAAARGDVTVG